MARNPVHPSPLLVSQWAGGLVSSIVEKIQLGKSLVRIKKNSET